MKKITILNTGVAFAALGLALGAAPVMAQTATPPAADTPAAPEAASPNEQIVVTGSSIRRPNLVTPSPIQMISQKELEMSGQDTIAGVLNTLTANGAGTLSANNSVAFAGGASGISLRGLSVAYTLTLIDGHRLAPYPLSDDGQRQFTDVASIPFNAIESVDVLKDGASAIYGSDAIAGVVNIPLKKEITGIEMMMEEGLAQHGGGETQHYGLSYGQGSLARDGYNAFITVEFRKQEEITLNQRQYEPWASDNFSSVGGNNLGPGQPNVLNAGLPATTTPYLVNPNASNPTTTPGAIAFLGAGCTQAKLAAGQCGSVNRQVLEAPTQNINVLVGFTKDFGDGWQAKFRGSFFDSKGQQSDNSPYTGYGSAYPGASYGGNVSNPIGGLPVTGIGAVPSFLVPANFPGNTLGVPAYLEGFLPQLNAPTINIDSQTIRLALDITGKVAGWDVTGSLGMSHVRTHTDYLNFVNYDTLYTDLTTFNSAGQPAFNPQGGNSAAELARVAPEFQAVATDAMYYAEFNATRKIMDLPGGDLHLAVGASFLDKQLNNPGAAPVLDGQIGGAFSAFAIGKQSDTAGYAELDATIFKTVDINVAGRDDYVNTYGNSFTPKAGITWRIVPPLLLRGTFSKGFRAPNPAEVGTAGSLFGLGAIADPLLCPNGSGGPFPAGTVPASCASSPGYAQRTNALKPEKSTSFTAGAAATPFKGFSLTGDYYHINIKDQIVSASELPSYAASLGELNGPCLRGPAVPTTISTGATNPDGTPVTTTGTPLYGPIAACVAGYVNAASTSTSGFDIEARYHFAVGAARFTLSANYTHMITYNLTAPNGAVYKLAGTHGPDGVSGDTGNPRDHINASVGLDLGKFSGVMSGYRIGSYSILDPSAGLNTCSEALGSAFMFIAQPTGAAQSSYCKVRSFTSVNLAIQYRVTPQFTWKMSVDNLFDASAPVDAQTYGGSFTPFNPSLHEDGVIGRFFRLGVDAKF